MPHMSAERRHVEDFTARLRTRKRLHSVVNSTRSLYHDAYTDHSPDINRAAIDAACTKLEQHQQSCQGTAPWPQRAYAAYISAKAAQVAQDAHTFLTRRKRLRNQPITSPSP